MLGIGIYCTKLYSKTKLGILNLVWKIVIFMVQKIIVSVNCLLKIVFNFTF